jgi:hypothetical protein
MRLIRFALVSVLLLGGVIFLISLIFPRIGGVERSGSIDAPMDLVFEHVTDTNTWRHWNPWDPNYANKISTFHYHLEAPDQRPLRGVFYLKPTTSGNGTALLWRLEMDLGYWPWWKFRGFLMDKMFGDTMERGLNQLKERVEKL